MNIETNNETVPGSGIEVNKPEGKSENSAAAAKKEKNNKTIHVKIFIIIILTAVVINICALAIGAVFLTRSVQSAMEDDMLVAVDIADRYVSKEIELLKLIAAEAASEIGRHIKSLEPSGAVTEIDLKSVLDNILKKHPMYTGLAVFNQLTLVDYLGETDVPEDIPFQPFMQTAYRGGQAVSTTMFCPDGSLVMYVSAPINDKMVLAAVLPGLYFSEIISHFTFWQTVHLFINDKDGYAISDFRDEWVIERRNFIELAKKDSSLNDLAAFVERGISGERSVSRFSLDGKPRICAFRPVSSSEEKWFIGIIAPLGESAINGIPYSILLMGIITLLLSVAAAFVAASLLKRSYDELFQLRDIAETVSMTKSTFLANMSHEIRTPMNSIVGFSELALDGECSPRTRDYLDKIRTNAQWLLQIINDILDISKVESGRMELENIPFGIHELFSSCRTLIMPAAIEKGITLYFYAEPSMGKKPLGDPSRLRQVFVNLLSNAVKFTNNGMVKLHAALTDMSSNTITMHFEVKDSGIGMTKEQIAKIFDPFIQADKGIARKYGGTGLGLSISKNIIEKMGGTLSVESTPGIGSKFSFDLVFDAIDANDEDMFTDKIVINELEKPFFEGEVLLCEDNVMNQQVISEHLVRVGLQPVIAVNGKTGVDLVKSRIDSGAKQFSLIFMDIHMPVMDGLEASSKILKLNTGVPIIAMTANIMSNDREIYRQNGMYDCVGKPFSSQELWRCLMKYLTPVSKSSNERNLKLETDAEYQKSLQVFFIKNHRDKYEEITKALEEDDPELAYRLAHTLKVNAGQLGRTILQGAASDVEKMLKNGENLVTEEMLNILKTELDMVINEFTSKNKTERDE